METVSDEEARGLAALSEEAAEALENVQRGLTVLFKLRIAGAGRVVGEKRSKSLELALNCIVCALQVLTDQSVDSTDKYYMHNNDPYKNGYMNGASDHSPGNMSPVLRRVFQWLVLCLDSGRSLGMNPEVLLGQAGRMYAHRVLTRGQDCDAGIKLLGCFFALVEASRSTDEANSHLPAAMLFGCVALVYRLAQVCHCYEICAAAPPLDSELPSSRPGNILSWVLQAPLNSGSYEKTATFVHGCGKVLQLTLYRSTESGTENGLGNVSANDLAFMLAESLKLGWVMKEAHEGGHMGFGVGIGSTSADRAKSKGIGVGGTALNVFGLGSGISNSSGFQPFSQDASRTLDPWIGAKVNVDLVLEFLLQRDDNIGVQGTTLVKEMISLCASWALLKQGSLDSFALQVALTVLRCLAPQFAYSLRNAAYRLGERYSKSQKKKGSKPRKGTKLVPSKYILGMVEIFSASVELSLKYDRHRVSKNLENTESVMSASYLRRNNNSDSRGGITGGPGAPYLTSKHQKQHIQVSSTDKGVTDAVTSMALPLMHYFASYKTASAQTAELAGSEPAVLTLGRAANLCFARIGTSDVHWATLFANGQKPYSDVETNIISEFEVAAAILRCAAHALQEQHSSTNTKSNHNSGGNSGFANVFAGIVSSLHELCKNESASMPALVAQSRRYRFEEAASGEYTVSLYAARVTALLFQTLKVSPQLVTGLSEQSASKSNNFSLTCAGGDSVSTFKSPFGDAAVMASSKLAILLPTLSLRTCNARLVYGLPVDTLLAWVPAISLVLGDPSELLGRAGGQTLFQLVESVALRGTVLDGQGGSSMDDEQKVEDLEAVFLRMLQTWHAIFATGRLPAWISDNKNGPEQEPNPFSDTYSNDLMLMLVHQQSTWRDGAPEWFRPFAAARQVRAVRERLEMQLRAALLPGGAATSSPTGNSASRSKGGTFVVGGDVGASLERPIYGLVGELVLPKLERLCAVLEQYTEAWRLNRYEDQHMYTRVAPQNLEAFFLGPLTSGGTSVTGFGRPSGAVGSTICALQELAEIFMGYGCLRGRIASAYYTNLAGLLAQQAGDFWEAGNAFATVASCITGSEEENQTHLSGSTHSSIASVFLKESLQMFQAVGANPERLRIQASLTNINPAAAAVPAPPGATVQEALSYYFLVGADCRSFASLGVAMSPLNVVRVIVRLAGEPGQDGASSRDGFALAETKLIQRLQGATALRLVEGSLNWRIQRQWVSTSTSTVADMHYILEPDLVVNESSLDMYYQTSIGKSPGSGKHAAGNRLKRNQSSGEAMDGTFWLRRLWPVQLEATDPESNTMLRCPFDFVVLPSSLDSSTYTEDWMVAPDPDYFSRFADGQTVPLDRVVLSTTAAGLSLLSAISPVRPEFLAPDFPPLAELLDRSPYGVPVGRLGQTLGPKGTTYVEPSSDSQMLGSQVISTAPPPPPDHPPPDHPPPSLEKAKADPVAAPILLELPSSLPPPPVNRETSVASKVSDTSISSADHSSDDNGAVVTSDRIPLPELPPKPPSLSPTSQPERGVSQVPENDAKEEPLATSTDLPTRTSSSANQEKDDGEFFVENPVLAVDGGRINSIPPPSIPPPSPPPTFEAGGLMLIEDDYQIVTRNVEEQEGWFSGQIVQPNGLRDVSIRILGLPPSSPIETSSPGAPNRRPSLLASLSSSLRRDSTASASSGRSRADTQEGFEPDGTPTSFKVQVWAGKSSGGLLRKKTVTQNLVEQMTLTSASVELSKTPGVVRLSSEERAKCGTNPILFQTGNPCALLATVAIFQAQAATAASSEI